MRYGTILLFQELVIKNSLHSGSKKFSFRCSDSWDSQIMCGAYDKLDKAEINEMFFFKESVQPDECI